MISRFNSISTFWSLTIKSDIRKSGMKIKRTRTLSCRCIWPKMRKRNWKEKEKEKNWWKRMIWSSSGWLNLKRLNSELAIWQLWWRISSYSIQAKFSKRLKKLSNKGLTSICRRIVKESWPKSKGNRNTSESWREIVRKNAVESYLKSGNSIMRLTSSR